MKTTTLLLALVLHSGVSWAETADPIHIIVDSSCGASEAEAARFLAESLAKLYPSSRFVCVDAIPEAGKAVMITRWASDATSVRAFLGDRTAAAESYEVFTLRNEGREIGVIAGADARGTALGVHALLERLGCGFYLSHDTFPAPRTDAFTFEGWKFSDEPLMKDRLVFNWHNFLSGCSTWNLADWQRWIRQSRKMGFNGIVVHAYGNNPMFSFEFNGLAKPVGYLSTTQRGRDWSTQHVNDVRRLWGGSVFDGPVFGADAAMVPEDRRVESAQTLMRQVFDDARRSEMDVYFALDVDTESSNPQKLITTLPESARFPVGGKGRSSKPFWLANPETPEGYRYYKTQVESLLTTYPQVNRLALWVRIGETPWVDLKLADLPEAWRKEYKAEVAKTPEAAKFAYSRGFFALAKVARAYERALKELGRSDVELAFGSWYFRFFPAAHRFLPSEIKLIALDYGVIRDQSQLRDEASRRAIHDIAANRPVQCIIWAQHDDGRYLGRSYTPFSDFHEKLADAGIGRYGIIHWTTRPLDLYFKSHAKQVWKSTRNQPLRVTCDEMAERSFGPSAREIMSEYLYRWITEAPQFGRETQAWFIHAPLDDIDGVVAGCKDRLKLIEGVDTAALTDKQQDRINYFKGLEEYIVLLYRAQQAYQTSWELFKAGKAKESRRAIAECHPEQAVESFARSARHGTITRGEQGLLVTMNLRWLPHILQHRQVLGLAPCRYNFAATSVDVFGLAQERGTHTFHFDEDHNIWQTLGVWETKTPVFTLPKTVVIVRDPAIPPEYEEICRSGLETDKPLSLPIRPIIHDSRWQRKGKVVLPAGRYRLDLLMLDPESTATGQNVAEYEFEGGASPVKDRIDVFEAAGGANRIFLKSHFLELGSANNVVVKIVPRKGKAFLCGVVLTPLELAKTVED
ncbi:MAG TPA: hypothetical protein DD670_00455 [Planctomycetaceae bacterium]|nr:hypothetical protein [Planctomycetaceae bacterium]